MSLFRSRKDIQYVKRITQELIEKVIGEKVTYYAISDEHTEDNFYGEAQEKIFDPPISIYCLVEWQEQEPFTNEYGQDLIYNMKLFISDVTTQKANIKLVEGDMVEYDDKKFEIVNITEPQQIFGKALETMGKTIVCRSVRESSFKVSISGSIDHSQRTRPDADDSPTYGETMYAFSASSTF